MSIAIPASWVAFCSAFEHVRGEMARGDTEAQALRDELEASIEELRAQIEAELPPPVIDGLPAEVAEKLRKEHMLLRGLSEGLALELDSLAADFTHARENGDKVVILVLGEVNSAKTTLGNHIAGVDFPKLGPHKAATCFVGDEVVPRLAEAPVECTRQYQGFERLFVHQCH